MLLLLLVLLLLLLVLLLLLMTNSREPKRKVWSLKDEECLSVEGVWLAGLPQEADVIVVGQEYVRDGVAVVPSFEELTQ